MYYFAFYCYCRRERISTWAKDLKGRNLKKKRKKEGEATIDNQT